jgi:hypothetical protein
VKRWLWVVAVLLGMLFAVFAFTPAEPQAQRAWTARGTTYSAGPRGTKALFLLLASIGLNTERLRRPSYEELAPGTVLWALTRDPIGRGDRRALIRFIQRGGRLLAPPHALAPLLEEAELGDASSLDAPGQLVTSWGHRLELEQTPSYLMTAREPRESYATAGGASVVAAWQIGAGYVVSLGVDELSRNDRIGQADNGPFLARLASTLGTRHVFDEFQTGFGDDSLTDLLSRAPYRWGFAQLLLALVVALAGHSMRRLPAQPSAPQRRRRSEEHVEAVARLWQQSRDAGLPLAAIMNAVAERARARLATRDSDRPFITWIEQARPQRAAEARESWERAQRLCEGSEATPDAARRLAIEITALEREASRW